MKIRKRLAAVPLAASVSLAAHAQHAATPADEAAAARANAEQNQHVQQQRDAQQRAAIVDAPAKRSTLPTDSGYPRLPVEQTCFKVDAFALDVPVALPASIFAKAASALPLDRFAFAL
jgi:hemolysin activation/secretion protein